MALCPAGGTTLSDAYRYDGFGQQIASAGTATNPWRYRGLLNIGSDSLTWALLDMGARDYSAQLGQFTQADSVQGSAANPLSMNRFLYALADPATLVDPDGHFAIEYDSGDPDAPGESCKALGDRGCGMTATQTKSAVTVHVNGESNGPSPKEDWTTGPTPLETLPGVTADERLRFFELSTTCAGIDVTQYPGSPCEWWQRLNDENEVTVESFCRDNPDYCSEQAKQKALGLGLIGVGLTCVLACVAAVETLTAGALTLRDRLRDILSTIGSTGRNQAQNLAEQIFIKAVRADPLAGETLPFKLGDWRWRAENGWIKMQQVYDSIVEGRIVIHYNYNTVTGKIADLKFVLPKPQ